MKIYFEYDYSDIEKACATIKKEIKKSELDRIITSIMLKYKNSLEI